MSSESLTVDSAVELLELARKYNLRKIKFGEFEAVMGPSQPPVNIPPIDPMSQPIGTDLYPTEEQFLFYSTDFMPETKADPIGED
jgi:hypothetical protein